MTADLVEQYLKSKELAWSPSTLNSESARLKNLIKHLPKTPHELYLYLRDERAMKPYTIKTTFLRLSSFWTWGVEESLLPDPNPYKQFMRRNARLFKHVYKKEKIDVTYEEARRRINEIGDPSLKLKALELLSTGMRFSESNTLEGQTIVGKGGKRRRVFFPESKDLPLSKDVHRLWSYKNFYKRLKAETGLKPHTLRKLAANRLVELGATASDLMEIMGWNNINTASSYLQARKDKELAKLMEAAYNG